MATPFREGKVWSFRLRIKGEDVFQTGFATLAAARQAMGDQRQALTSEGKPAHRGPWRSTLAEALAQYARERLPVLKGAVQDATRINRYLRAAGLNTIKLKAAEGVDDGSTKGIVLWVIEFVPARTTRVVPQGLTAHRQAQAMLRISSDKQRRVLALKPTADVEPYDIQKLIDTMSQDGYKPATIGLERALLRQLFAYASKTWHWPKPTRNPATGLKLPTIDNGRERVLTNGEWGKIVEALETTRNSFVAPALALLLETPMRSGEALVNATWENFDAEQCILHLTDAKAGARDVPLNPGAMAVLQQLLAATPQPLDRLTKILPLTYEALKAAWQRACERAGIAGVNIHDLRHTAATRFSLELHGNMPVLKVITGHKTDKSPLRYINVKAVDVVRILHGRALDEESAPAGLRAINLTQAGPQASVSPVTAVAPPSNVLQFPRRVASA